jgi:hypothetical protein
MGEADSQQQVMNMKGETVMGNTARKIRAIRNRGRSRS